MRSESIKILDGVKILKIKFLEHLRSYKMSELLQIKCNIFDGVHISDLSNILLFHSYLIILSLGRYPVCTAFVISFYLWCTPV